MTSNHTSRPYRFYLVLSLVASAAGHICRAGYYWLREQAERFRRTYRPERPGQPEPGHAARTPHDQLPIDHSGMRRLDELRYGAAPTNEPLPARSIIILRDHNGKRTAYPSPTCTVHGVTPAGIVYNLN